MRAAVVERYGEPEAVRVVEVADPSPGRGEVLVRVHATAVTSADARIRGARFPPGFGAVARLAFGLRRPRRPVLGGVFSGVVEVTGPAVEGVAVGDEVCGMTGIRMGAHAELLVVPATKAVPKPASVSHDQAAGLLFGATTAHFFLRRKAEVTPGARVLVVGAAGAVGTSAVQLAARAGAEVTGVCRAANAPLVERLGAAHVIDHTATPLAEVTEHYDIVLDAVGSLTASSGRRLLRDGGVLLLAVASLGDTLRARRHVRTGTATERPDDIAELLAMVADQTLTVVIDGVSPLSDIADAHRRVDTGRKVGNLIIHP